MLARLALESGWSVIVDAAFLRLAQRKPFLDLAAELKIPFFVFDLHASPATMHKRVLQRQRENKDASDADTTVLERQLLAIETLSEEESRHAITVDMDKELEAASVRKVCAPIIKSLAHRR